MASHLWHFGTPVYLLNLFFRSHGLTLWHFWLIWLFIWLIIWLPASTSSHLLPDLWHFHFLLLFFFFSLQFPVHLWFSPVSTISHYHLFFLLCFFTYGFHLRWSTVSLYWFLLPACLFITLLHILPAHYSAAFYTLYSFLPALTRASTSGSYHFTFSGLRPSLKGEECN